MLYWSILLYPKRRAPIDFKSKAANESQSPFKTDFESVCNSTVLRRLQDKAQVFPLEEGDYARSRLTHSIEVLAIAQSLGNSVIEIIKDIKFRKYINPKYPNLKTIYNPILSRINDIPTILMTAALLHDMGNPPFGHLSEQIINDWFTNNLSLYRYDEENGKLIRRPQNKDALGTQISDIMKSDLLHFDGNAQLLRLVTKLDNYYVADNGMDLTYPVMASFIKYPCPSNKTQKNILSRKKAGFYFTEKEIFEDIELTLGLKKGNNYCRHPLAFLLEAADDIAYLTADFEDAHHKGILSLEDISRILFNSGRLNEYDKTDYTEPPEDETYKPTDPMVNDVLDAIEKYKEKAKRNGYPDKETYVIHRIREYIKGRLINAIPMAFEKLYKEIMEGKCEKELLKASEARVLAECLDLLEKKHIHYCNNIVTNKIRAISVINKLMDTYIPAIVEYDKDKHKSKDTQPNLINMSFSVYYRFVCEQANLELESKKRTETDPKKISEINFEILYNKLRLVIDQISGMTDSRALSDYHTIIAK